MTSTPKVCRRKAPEQPALSDSFSLESDLTQNARARVGWAAVAMGVMSFLGILFTLAYEGVGMLEPGGFERQMTVFGVNLLITLAIWSMVRAPQVSDARALRLGWLLEALICFGAAIGTNTSSYERFGVVADLSWTTPIIILFPFLIPCPPKRMLVASLLIALVEPLSVALMWLTMPIEPELRHMTVVIAPLLGAGLAYACARVVWGLNVEVTRARRLGSY